jgi:hypothetical protein
VPTLGRDQVALNRGHLFEVDGPTQYGHRSLRALMVFFLFNMTATVDHYEQLAKPGNRLSIFR